MNGRESNDIEPQMIDKLVKLNNGEEMSRIILVSQLIAMQLYIPGYQRPYKWTRKNVADLLNDIGTAIEDNRCPGYDKFRYRVGTVIIHNKKDETGNTERNIVDGQQRLITLSLIKRALDPSFTNSLLEHKYKDKVSIGNISDNYLFILEWKSVNSGKLQDYRDAFEKLLEAVLIEVDDISEAFQLFDSQNTRGRELDPHDLLKAYHLREMNEYAFEKFNLVKRWEEIQPYRIRELFSLYLYPILNWSRKEKSKAFTAQDIDTYKGVSSDCLFTYAERVKKAMPCFQIDQPFAAGGDFFRMVEHYINLLADLKNEIFKESTKFVDIKRVIEDNIIKRKDNTEQYSSTGFRYAVNLFYCILLFYFDRFHMYDEMAVNKLFVWAMMIRVDMENLGFDTINNYAIGNEDKDYTNRIPMFFKIATARNNQEITNLRIQVVRPNDQVKSEKWKDLYKELKDLMGEKQ